MTEEATWNIEVRHRCAKCERLAVVYDDNETPLCARHATIFMVDHAPSRGEEDDRSVR